MTTTRREFICGVAAVALVGAEGCAAAPSVRANVEGDTLRIDLAQWPPDAKVVVARREDRKSPVILVRDADSFRAFSSVCPHQGCIVRPQADNLVCPCHGSVFALDGEVQRGPAVNDLAEWKTRLDEESLVLLVLVPEGP